MTRLKASASSSSGKFPAFVGSLEKLVASAKKKFAAVVAALPRVPYKTVVQDLPVGLPGCYLVFDGTPEPAYVGKAKDLRERLLGQLGRRGSLVLSIAGERGLIKRVPFTHSCGCGQGVICPGKEDFVLSEDDYLKLREEILSTFMVSLLSNDGTWNNGGALNRVETILQWVLKPRHGSMIWADDDSWRAILARSRQSQEAAYEATNVEESDK